MDCFKGTSIGNQRKAPQNIEGFPDDFPSNPFWIFWEWGRSGWIISNLATSWKITLLFTKETLEEYIHSSLTHVSSKTHLTPTNPWVISHTSSRCILGIKMCGTAMFPLLPTYFFTCQGTTLGPKPLLLISFIFRTSLSSRTHNCSVTVRGEWKHLVAKFAKIWDTLQQVDWLTG